MNAGLEHIAWDYPEPFVIEFAVTPDEIDGYGHVNNSVYVSWLDRCAWAHSADVGLPLDACVEMNRGMAVIRHEIDYLASAYAGDQIAVANWITRNDKRLRAERRFQVVRPADGRTLLRSVTSYVCTDLKRGRPARMPPEFVATYVLLDSVAAVIEG